MIEEFVEKIANTQAFHPRDPLGKTVEQYDRDELPAESLDLVYAAYKADASYAAFLRLVQEKSSKRK